MTETEPFLTPFDGAAEELRAIIEPALGTLGLELVQLVYIRQLHKDTVRILTDRPEATAKIAGVQIADLERANRVLSDLLDVEDQAKRIFAHSYDLEVGSPGVDRPLTKRSHFTKHAGALVKVKTKHAIENARSFSGPLGVSDGGIRVGDVAIPFDAIQSAHIVFVFEQPKKPGKKK